MPPSPSVDPLDPPIHPFAAPYVALSLNDIDAVTSIFDGILNAEAVGPKLEEASRESIQRVSDAMAALTNDTSAIVTESDFNDWRTFEDNLRHAPFGREALTIGANGFAVALAEIAKLKAKLNRIQQAALDCKPVLPILMED